jgi:hypothetical protein
MVVLESISARPDKVVPSSTSRRPTPTDSTLEEWNTVAVQQQPLSRDAFYCTAYTRVVMAPTMVVSVLPDLLEKSRSRACTTARLFGGGSVRNSACWQLLLTVVTLLLKGKSGFS